MSDLLLQTASRVEAAVEAYVSVRDLGKTDEWKERFREESVSDHLHGVSTDLHWE
jgi:hypothetical protein